MIRFWLSLFALICTLPLTMSELQAQPQPPADTFGPNPKLSPPQEGWLPTLKVPKAETWGEREKPNAAQGLDVKAFARNLKHPRWIYVLPNGDVLVAEASTESASSWDPRSLVQNWAQRRVGAITENANRISILRDTDGDGIADEQSVFLDGLRQPFGMALIGDQFYVANTDSVVRYSYRTGDKKITGAGTKLVDLPVGHHWTRNIMPSADQTKLFITVGSGSNIGENGMEIEKDRATIWELDLASGKARIYASGLRNANGMTIEPSTGALWAVVNERDEIGDDVPPDYLTSVKEGAFYGWPYSYWGKNVDQRVQPQRPDLVATAVAPDYALGAHTASLGLAYYNGKALPDPYRNGMFIGQHGSWNRSELSGYKVVFVPFSNGVPIGRPIDVLTGFLNDDASVSRGRPVGVAVTKDGTLLVADDVGNTIWHVESTSPSSGLKAPATSGAGDQRKD